MDALVVSWREKVKNDHVRPTSVVHGLLGDETLLAWAGPGSDEARSIHWFPYDPVGVVNVDP